MIFVQAFLNEWRQYQAEKSGHQAGEQHIPDDSVMIVEGGQMIHFQGIHGHKKNRDVDDQNP